MDAVVIKKLISIKKMVKIYIYIYAVWQFDFLWGMNACAPQLAWGLEVTQKRCNSIWHSSCALFPPDQTNFLKQFQNHKIRKSLDIIEVKENYKKLVCNMKTWKSHWSSTCSFLWMWNTVTSNKQKAKEIFSCSISLSFSCLTWVSNIF